MLLGRWTIHYVGKIMIRRKKIACRRCGLMVALLAVIAILSPAHSQSGSPPRFPTRISADGSHLVDQVSEPYFINGDTAWSLIAQLSASDAELYLTDRRTKGFNVVLTSLIEHTFADRAPANAAGAQPFVTQGSIGTPNEAYFAHADWVIARAAEKGITVLLAPIYLGYQCGSQGWCAEVRNSSLATMREYGRYVGNRYKNAPNIVWLIGGDADPIASGVGEKVRQFVEGLREYDSAHLITAHNAPEQAAMDVWGNEGWLNLNNIYTYGSAAAAAQVQNARTGRKPFFLLETFYEREHESTPLALRRQAYWTVLSGGVSGHVFGNCPLWNFGAASAASFCTGASWQSQLDSTGSTSLGLVGRLFTTRFHHRLVPDDARTVLTGGHQSGDSQAVAARASDGSTVIAYIPTRRTVTVALSSIAGGSAKGWWFNPRTGSATVIGTFPASGTSAFTPPDTNDWVLVLDNAALNLPAPGTTSVGSTLPPPMNLRIVP